MSRKPKDMSNSENIPKEPAPKRVRRSPSVPFLDQSNIISCNKTQQQPALAKSPSLVVDESDAELKEMGLHRIMEAGGDSNIIEEQESEEKLESPLLLLGRSNTEERKLRLTGHKDLCTRFPNENEQSPDLRRFKKFMRMPFVVTGPNYFDRLSDEIIIGIFKWLPKQTLARVALVCKRFRDLSADEAFWKRLDLGVKSLPAGVLGQVIHRGVIMLRAARSSFADPIFTTPTGFTYSPEIRPCKLQYLDLSVVSMSLQNLEQLLGVCKHLKKLSLEHVHISDRVCFSIAQNKSLTTLHMAMTTGTSSNGLVEILQNCTKLRELNLGWADLTSSSVSAVVINLPPTLTQLNISGCRETLNDEHVRRIVVSCPNLIELDLSDSLEITQESIDHICDNLDRIEALSFSRCYKIAPAAYLNLETCPSLRYLNVFGVLRDKSLEHLIMQLRRIEINKFMFSAIARPTVGIKRTSIWGLRVRD